MPLHCYKTSVLRSEKAVYATATETSCLILHLGFHFSWLFISTESNFTFILVHQEAAQIHSVAFYDCFFFQFNMFWTLRWLGKSFPTQSLRKEKPSLSEQWEYLTFISFFLSKDWGMGSRTAHKVTRVNFLNKISVSEEKVKQALSFTAACK